MEEKEREREGCLVSKEAIQRNSGFGLFGGLQLDDETSGNKDMSVQNSPSISVSIKDGLKKIGEGKMPRKDTYDRMLALAAHSLAKVCNAVVIARLLNSSLVIPRFMYSSVWRDVSHIYQEEHFINYLTPDIRIVKELPKELQSQDLEAIGSTIQETGALLLQRLRKHGTHPGSLDRYLTGPFAEPSLKGKVGRAVKASRYLAIHLRDSICATIALAYLQLGMLSDILQATFSGIAQLAALDFIACTASDAFAMTDSGSQLSSLVSGFRIYYGGGKMPTIRPNKRRLADIFMKNNTIEWKIFEQRVRKAVRQAKHVFERPKARSVYRYPRCKECMCLTE
ncbi:hypothetical protein NC653_010159 [Populus alba x Populus x berolinensis]|uniref:O-fucosyltransferase family protein n=1 Tax=Populus alba x Populus x berolinensis TaxID=444605 RepID=A0AAD6W5E8_9ROSI|nr:hypothetical protein NC653_010159 [Populus alba x Populus x berolinensis]